MIKRKICKYVDNLLSDDEVSPEEAGFLLGYYFSDV